MHMTVTIQIRNIHADDYIDARIKAFSYINTVPRGEALLSGILTREDDWWTQWCVMAKVAKEADGTFTVTIP